MLEVIAASFEDALLIDQSQADRIELVSSMNEGGLTPDLSLIDKVLSHVTLPVRIMIRPHSKSFVYNQEDQANIFRTINYVKSTKAEGIVFGGLKNNERIDYDLLNEIIKRKGHLKLTFHRAIDALKTEFDRELMNLLNIVPDTILTSMNQPNAVDSINRYTKYKPLFERKNVELLAGSGLNVQNIPLFLKETKLKSIHIGSSARLDGKISKHQINQIKLTLHQITSK